MVNKASNDSKLRYRNEWKNIEPLAIQVSELISKAPLPARNGLYCNKILWCLEVARKKVHAIVHSGLNSNRNNLTSSTASLTNIPTIITTSPSSSLKNSNRSIVLLLHHTPQLIRQQSNNLTSYDEVEKGFRQVGVGRDDSDVGEAQEEDDDNNKNMEFKFDLDLTTINVMDYIDDFEKKLLEYSEKEQVVQDFNKNNIDLIQYSKQSQKLKVFQSRVNQIKQSSNQFQVHVQIQKVLMDERSALIDVGAQLSLPNQRQSSLRNNSHTQTSPNSTFYHIINKTPHIFRTITAADAAAAGSAATAGGEGGTDGTGDSSTSGSTGIIAGSSSDWKDSSDASEDSSKGSSDSISSSASDSFSPSPKLQIPNLLQTIKIILTSLSYEHTKKYKVDDQIIQFFNIGHDTSVGISEVSLSSRADRGDGIGFKAS
ncbi:hypothetical protein DICPUDRAFT_159242 [Dictyostelium purpureum]|uniref:Uncharacterized protein n=1 Tax=Dictyostelium purpureum TaxID=5786 RepID=F1A3M4_DICPU|nr:uncharacterized protein DICPUDRAFT_159242 [Dictyostelium purpureum]EGC29210.1 hypothetical protein DICPUDRAFT_159242 [Dictyostelium purpureum]|eukprot:XP_003294268.1 hypothetical protein DICPUDRAFT_159242 [Dictyostelium purpureum]